MGKGQSGTRRDLMIAVWEGLDCESVGAAELDAIQRAVAEQFSEGAVESPAAIARILADEGAVLRHPEILESDARWRESKFSQITRADLDFSTLGAANKSINELERRRQELARIGNGKGLSELRESVRQSRRECLLVAESSVLLESERAEAQEIAGWLQLWLRTPELVVDWLDLRQASPDFRDRFGKS